LFHFKTPTDNLNFGEPLGNIVDTLTSDDLALLSDGLIVNKYGDAHYEQYLAFPSLTGSQLQDMIERLIFTHNTSEITQAFKDVGVVVIEENDDDDLNMYLIFPEDGRFVEYSLMFAPFAESDIRDGHLTDLENEPITIMGEEYVFYDSVVDTTTNAATLRLLRALVMDTVVVDETRTYAVGNASIEISAKIINRGLNQTMLNINGVETAALEKGDVERIGDLYFYIEEVWTNRTDILGPKKDSVDIIIASKTIELQDDDTSDSSYFKGFSVNGDHMQDADVLITASNTGEEFQLTEIKYRLLSDAKGGSMYVPPLGMLSSAMREPEALLGFDLLFAGPSPGQTSGVLFKPVGNERYELHFANRLGEQYTIPLVDNSDEETGFKYGTDDEMLWFTEGYLNETGSNHNCTIEDNDYFVLTSEPDYKASTTVLRFVDSDSTDGYVTLEKPAAVNDSAIKDYYSNSSIVGLAGEGILDIDGESYRYYVTNVSTLCFDMNDDGDVGYDEVPIVINGGGILDLGHDQDPDNTAGLDAFNITLRTVKELFDGDGLLNQGVDEMSWIQVEETDDGVDISVPRPSTVGGSVMFEADNTDTLVHLLHLPPSNYQLGGTLHGSLFILTDSDDHSDAETLTLVFTHAQGGVEVMVGSAPVLEAVRGQILAMLAAASQPPAPAPAPAKSHPSMILDSRLSDEKYLVAVGGPCVNELTRNVLGASADDCTAHFEPGEALITLVEYEGKYVLVIAGYDAEDTQRAAKAALGLTLAVGERILV